MSLAARGERKRQLEGALHSLERAMTQAINGSSGAAAVNRMLEARDELKKSLAGLRLKRQS